MNTICEAEKTRQGLKNNMQSIHQKGGRFSGRRVKSVEKFRFSVKTLSPGYLTVHLTLPRQVNWEQLTRINLQSQAQSYSVRNKLIPLTQLSQF